MIPNQSEGAFDFMVDFPVSRANFSLIPKVKN